MKPEPQELLRGAAHDVRTWVQGCCASDGSLPATYPWHALAEGAALRARSSGASAEADEWARVALLVYGALARAPDGLDFELSAMNLRAWMVERFGAEDGHDVRDFSHIVEWFLRSTEMPLADARGAARRLRETPLEQWSSEIELVRALRRVKNRMNVLRWLKATPLPPEVQRWLQLWEELP